MRKNKYSASFLLLNFLAIILLQLNVNAQMDITASPEYEAKLLPGELWWGGLSFDGHLMPYGKAQDISRNLYGNNAGNQAQPLLISNKGRYVWSEEPFSYEVINDSIKITSNYGKLSCGKEGENLPEVFKFVSQKFFPSNGKIPDPFMFKEPQYNTWIELIYNQNEEDILNYARAIIDKGYPPGVLMIDDNWQEDYGDWEFSARRFKNPKAMIKELHDLGFKVMLWICPFISADSDEFRYLTAEGMLLLDKDKTQEILWANTQSKAAIVRWWNGASGLLDLSNPKSQKWFDEKMQYLVDEYGVDGFKLDAGDSGFYTGDVVSFIPSTPNEHTEYFAKAGLKYPLNEYRASWKMAGLPLAQRLRDKHHKWQDLHELIPGIIGQGLMGYAYTCPDMIGGGAYTSFLKGAIIDEELIVRSAQVHALMPMMQFSVAPWRVLNENNEKICREMALLHSKYGDRIIEMAKESSVSGEPIARSLAYNFPNDGYEMVKDQFMLGTDLMVTPIIEKNQRSRTVLIPKGKWKDEQGKVFKGPKKYTIDVPLERLPYFEKM